MKIQRKTKLRLTGSIAMYRNTINSGHKIDGRTWQGKEVIKRVKEMNFEPCDYTNHTATKYLSIRDIEAIKLISLN